MRLLDHERFRRWQVLGLTPLWRLRTRWPATQKKNRAEDLSQETPHPAALPTQRSVWQLFKEPSSAALSSTPSQVSPSPQVAAATEIALRQESIATLDWEALEATIRSCQACVLARERTQAVPGVGNRQGEWLFVGEGPGREEDRQGEPFVGPAGKLLDEMLFALGLARGKEVYITNAVKCRPPLNRTPHPQEIASCFPFLARQIALISPKIIVALGKPAAQALLNEEVKIAQARGKRFTYQGIPVVVTYHPAYLLRNPADKRKAWEDLLWAKQIWQQQV